MTEPTFQRGTENNWPGKSAKGQFELLGGKETKPEKAYTIIRFPGGDVEIARTSDGNYWVHVAVTKPDSAECLCNGEPAGQILDSRTDDGHMAVLVGVN